MNRVFIDLDGVIVDFVKFMRDSGMSADDVKKHPQAYLLMEPIVGALSAVRTLIARGHAVWVATKPPTGVHQAYGDKAAWVLHHLPELATRIVITHDKGFLGDSGDYLIDDRPHKANCHEFAGTLIPFMDGMTWEKVLDMFPGVLALENPTVQTA